MTLVLESKETTKKLSKFERAKTGLPHVLTDRDRAILGAVSEYRVLSRDQIRRLLGFGTVTRVNFRLMKLFHNGYLRRDFLPLLKGSSQAIYSLDRLGFPVAAERLGKDVEEISRARRSFEPFFLAHQLAVNNVRISFALAARAHPDHSLMAWLPAEEAQDRFFFGTDWHTLTPDAFGRFRVGRQVLSFFLEVDRGTMPNRRFKEKVDRYVAYDASGRYMERHKGQRFRVLVVTKSDARAANLKRTTRAVTHRYFHFATLPKIWEHGVLAAVWEPVEGEGMMPLFQTESKEAHAR